MAAQVIITTSTAHGYNNGDRIKLDGVHGMTQVNGLYFLVADATTYTFVLKNIDGTYVDGTLYDRFIVSGIASTSRKAITIVTGLDHLLGEYVNAVTDGVVVMDIVTPTIPRLFLVQAVTGGIGFVLDTPATVVHAGLPYTGKIKLLPLGDGSATGTGQTKMRRIYLSTLRLWKSLGGKVGLTEDKLSSLSYPTHSGVLYTGDIEKFPFTNWNKYSSFIIEQDQPYPMMLLSAILLSEEEEK